jgi:enoyl-CoA hydratase/carnithine racemase
MSAVPQSDEPVLIREDLEGACTLTMNRPQQMNLLTSEMIAAIQSALDGIAQDSTVRVLVLAAMGKGFCAGHDLKEIRALA